MRMFVDNNFELAKQFFMEGLTLLEQGELRLAESKLLQAIEIIPNRISTLTNLAAVQIGLKKYSEARLTIEKSLLLDSFNADAYLNLGLVEKSTKNLPSAISCFERAIQLNPEYPEAWSNKGAALNDLRRYSEAISCFERAIELNPEYPEAYLNKGNTLHKLGHFDEAITYFDKARDFKPEYPEAYLNKGNTLHELGHYDEAVAYFDRAIALKPDFAEAHLNKGISLLLRGNFEEGLPLYENRWNAGWICEVAGKRFFDRPTWLGVESLKGKVILLYGEQGLGDFIQFCRYVKCVEDLGARVILEVPRSLHRLLYCLVGVSQLVVKGESLPPFDFQCPLLSIPLALQANVNNIPSAVGYINNNKNHIKVMEWKERLGQKLRPRIGLAWSGNPEHDNDHNRSISLKSILPYLPDRFEYFCLQRDVRVEDKVELISNPKILNFSEYLTDFSETAALIDCLDLIISVDTSIAHLSGALGKKTWILLPYTPDWRWLLNRIDSPWYPSAQLFRQSKIGDWLGVYRQVKKSLELFA